LKFAASFVAENKTTFKASVGLEKVDMSNDFYHLSGSDNIILIYTNRYRENPLVIKGAGAGADVTASGIVGDIIRSGNHLE
jgi:aspartokinase/homoserine dehydrogenase 1